MTKQKCSVPSCDIDSICRGYCSGHYQRWQRGGDLSTPLRRKVNPGDPCKAKSCTGVAVSAGLCDEHYEAKKADRNTCMEDGCNAPQLKRYRCEFHYHAWYLAYGKITLEEKCLRLGCQRPGGEKTQLCRVHYKQAWLYGMTTSEYVTMWNRPYCSNIECGSTKNLQIDHDHSCCPDIQDRNKGCGKCVRGLLCGGCNKALGMLNDDLSKLRGLAAYLGG